MNPSEPILKILLYHGVTGHISYGIENFSKKHIDVADFEHQIKYISEHCVVLSMDEVVDLHHQGKPYPHNAVAVTFDDGFKNNLTHALPILEKYNVPATFYITAGIINTNIMFWVDQLEDAINHSRSNRITIELDGRISKFELGKDIEKISALKDIKAYCKLSQKSEKDRVIAEVLSGCDWVPSVENSPNYEKLTWKELLEMNGSELVTIGGHSMYHEVLTSIRDKERLTNDIELSIRLLEYNLQEHLVHYSYPEGQQRHYNKDIIEILKRCGIKCSPSGIHGVNKSGEFDLFNLRRIMVGFNGIEFPYDSIASFGHT